MAKVQRVGDQDSGGGKIIRGDNSVRVNGKPIAVIDSPVTPHPGRGEHNHAKTKANKNTTVKANGKLIVVTGDTDSCGHKRQGGSPNVNIG
jgi:uncharacterized Zn-binding protein involved in type VI secretion